MSFDLSLDPAAVARQRTGTRWLLEWVMPLTRAWQYRDLIRAVVRRELSARFKGSILGWLWAIFGPLVMLTFYTIIFSSAVGVPKSAAAGGVKTYALSIFTGLICFNLFTELAYRAPGLLQEHVNFIKKSIFPSETLAWTATIRALVYAGISFAVLLIFQIAVTGGLPWAILLLPLVVIPFTLFILGVSWFLMALGSFTRDVSFLMTSIVPVMMFATPIFYSITDVPEKARVYFRLNIVGNYIDMIRELLLHGQLPDLQVYAGTILVSLLVFRFGYRFFMRYRAIFVDVI